MGIIHVVDNKNTYSLIREIDFFTLSCYNGLADFGSDNANRKLQSKDKNATHAFSACQSR
jgi:hypothetical protein